MYELKLRFSLRVCMSKCSWAWVALGIKALENLNFENVWMFEWELLCYFSKRYFRYDFGKKWNKCKIFLRRMNHFWASSSQLFTALMVFGLGIHCRTKVFRHFEVNCEKSLFTLHLLRCLEGSSILWWRRLIDLWAMWAENHHFDVWKMVLKQVGGLRAEFLKSQFEFFVWVAG